MIKTIRGLPLLQLPKNMRFILFLVAIAFMPAYCHSQTCLSHALLEQQMQADAGVAAKRASMEDFTRQWIADHERTSGAPRNVQTIMVVVHVVWRTAEENISDDQVISQIEALNRDFRRFNLDIANVTYTPFQLLIADTEIEFQLASVDPSGNPTSGITRTQTSFPEIGVLRTFGKRAICYTDLGGHDAWCSNRYLNIWVGAFPTGIAGESSFPGQDIPEEDGVRIAPQRFGTTGTVSAPYHKGRTAVHEVGHYLNLFHVWGGPGDSNPDCIFSDEVEDTPPQMDNYLNECPTFTVPLQFSCTLLKPDMFCNYMNYTDDACMVMFTPGQRARMNATLEGPRSQLIFQTDECLPVANTIEPTPPDLVCLQPNPADQYVIVEGMETGSVVRCYDLKGVLCPVYQVVGNKIQLGHLQPGAYVLQIKNERNMITKMLIIARL